MEVADLPCGPPKGRVGAVTELSQHSSLQLRDVSSWRYWEREREGGREGGEGEGGGCERCVNLPTVYVIISGMLITSLLYKFLGWSPQAIERLYMEWNRDCSHNN